MSPCPCPVSSALTFDCANNLLALTGNNLAGETYTNSKSLVRISLTTGAQTVVCPFATTDRVVVRVAGCSLAQGLFFIALRTAPSPRLSPMC